MQLSAVFMQLVFYVFMQLAKRGQNMLSKVVIDGGRSRRRAVAGRGAATN
jgi:hypothetical protein